MTIHLLPQTLTSEVTGQIKIVSHKKNHNNLDIKDKYFLKLELAIPCKVMAMTSNCPEEKSKAL